MTGDKPMTTTIKPLAAAIAVFSAVISLDAILFLLAVTILPEKDSRLLCPPAYCEKSGRVLTLVLLPLALLVGFALNVALWCGIRWNNGKLLTVWIVFHELLYYLQLFVYIANVTRKSIPDMIDQGDVDGFIKYWILPIIFLWIYNRVLSVIKRCKKEIQLEPTGKFQYSHILAKPMVSMNWTTPIRRDPKSDEVCLV